MAAGATLTGDKQLDRQLKALGGPVVKKAVRAGIQFGMNPVVKEMKAQVAFSDAPVGVKTEIVKTIGKRLIAKKNTISAKVGFGIGTKAQKKKRAAAAKAQPGRAGGHRPGVGLGDQNAHWFVLGAKDREHKSGKSTGNMEAMFLGLAERAVAASAKKSTDAAGKAIGRVITREARKRQ